jgi:hypothetical protein
MHFNFDFSAAQILWTLTFAALLVLLVVLLGRDRAQRFPWFTASIVTMGLLLLTPQLLLNRMSRFTGIEIFLALSLLDVAIALGLLVELARRSFRGMGKPGWIIGTLAIVAGGAAVLVFWGPWPAWKTVLAGSELAMIRLMDLAVGKGMLFSSIVTIELGIMITLVGRRYGAGWHSHAQRISIGLSTAALAQLMLQVSLQALSMHTRVTPQNYDRVMDIRDKLIDANKLAYFLVLVWWVACLWFDEPGTPSAAEAATEPDLGDGAALQAHDPGEATEPQTESGAERPRD